MIGTKLLNPISKDNYLSLKASTHKHPTFKHFFSYQAYVSYTGHLCPTELV